MKMSLYGDRSLGKHSSEHSIKALVVIEVDLSVHKLEDEMVSKIMGLHELIHKDGCL